MKSNLGIILKIRGISLSELSRLTKITRPTLTQLSNNFDKSQIATAVTVAKALNVSLDDLLVNDLVKRLETYKGGEDIEGK